MIILWFYIFFFYDNGIYSRYLWCAHLKWNRCDRLHLVMLMRFELETFGYEKCHSTARPSPIEQVLFVFVPSQKVCFSVGAWFKNRFCLTTLISFSIIPIFYLDYFLDWCRLMCNLCTNSFPCNKLSYHIQWRKVLSLYISIFLNDNINIGDWYFQISNIGYDILLL